MPKTKTEQQTQATTETKEAGFVVLDDQTHEPPLVEHKPMTLVDYLTAAEKAVNELAKATTAKNSAYATLRSKMEKAREPVEAVNRSVAHAYWTLGDRLRVLERLVKEGQYPEGDYKAWLKGQIDGARKTRAMQIREFLSEEEVSKLSYNQAGKIVADKIAEAKGLDPKTVKLGRDLRALDTRLDSLADQIPTIKPGEQRDEILQALNEIVQTVAKIQKKLG